MTAEDRTWLDEHRNFLYVSHYITKEQKQMLYDIYNRLTGEKKEPNNCGRCLRNTLNIIKLHYERV
jgi:hypothetical protein